MAFKIGDRIVLKKESVKHLSEVKQNAEFANGIMEILSINYHTIFRVKNDSGLFKNIYVGGILEYRLATDSEIKLDKIKKMFINK
jgi:hypothetical protein